MAARAPRNAERSNAGEIVCPECGRTFSRAAALGAHRRRVHGVVGQSRRPAKQRQRRPRPEPRQNANAGIDRDALLKIVFPSGLPASASTVSAVAAWLEEADRLSRTG